MSGEILVLNTGSSSIKFSLFFVEGGPDELSLRCQGRSRIWAGGRTLRLRSRQGAF
jgi:acetate kinase